MPAVAGPLIAAKPERGTVVAAVGRPAAAQETQQTTVEAAAKPPHQEAVAVFEATVVVRKDDLAVATRQGLSQQQAGYSHPSRWGEHQRTTARHGTCFSNDFCERC